jgi:NAD(P)-dependent dehydrogenase (short-subunit alcohol dehydrogenase family)
MEILITGASRGMGLEFVRQFAARGDRVFAGARRPIKAQALQALQAKFPQRVTLVPLDVADEPSIWKAQQIIQRLTDRLDLLINNAGIYSIDQRTPDNPGESQTIGRLQQKEALEFFKVNAIGPVLIAQQFLGLLRKGKDPKIVSITSGYGSVSSNEGFPYHYSASKAALNMYTRSLAADLKDAGVTAVAMNPGWVSTDMGGSAAPVTPQQSVEGMIQVIDKLTPSKTSRFLTWQGGESPW